MFQQYLKFCLLSLISIKCSHGALTRTTPTPSAVATNGIAPTLIMKPDLSFLDDPYYSCFSIKRSSACEGFSYYIPNSGYYGTIDNSGPEDVSVADFDKFVNEDINENSSFIVALCPDADIKHDTRYIAYRNSVYCGRLMYAQARWCRENDDFMRSNPQLSLCKSTCLEFANSIVDYGRNICKNVDDTVAEEIKYNIIEQWCSIFSDDNGCISGTTAEVRNCGYLSASISQEAQTFNPQNSCWKSEEKMEEIKNKAKEEDQFEAKMGAIRWKVAYPLSIIIITGVATGYFWRKQNDLYKNGIIRLPEPVEKILPSRAQPSRDYVDEAYIQSILQKPQSTLPRSASVKSTLNRVKDNDKVIYMVALYNYQPRKDDELELKAGDRIRVEHKYDDGWGAGINESTSKFGAFPLICCSDNVSSNTNNFPSRKNSGKIRSRSHKTHFKTPLRTEN